MNKKELKAICKEHNIKGVSGKTKPQLVEMLRAKGIAVAVAEKEKEKKAKVKKERKEVQAHGFQWEKELILRVYQATPDEVERQNYTSKIDLPAALNRLDGCNVSMKTSCSPNSVCMADCLRVFDAVSSGNPLHLVVVFYKQDDATNTKKLVSIVEVDLTNSRELLFGTLTRAHIESLDKLVKSVPQKRKPTDEEYAKMYALKEELQKLGGALRLDIKCNSQQSRLQCSFNHFQSFLEKNPAMLIAKSNTHEFRGGSISSEIVSSRRVFTKKEKPNEESH